MTDRILSESRFSRVIDLPVDPMGVSDWLFTPPEAEYRRCSSPDHLS